MSLDINRRIYNEELVMNCCGVSNLQSRGFIQRRPGRHDHYMAYIHSGKIIIHEEDRDLMALPGDIMYYKPYEAQHYSLLEGDETVYSYMHFTGSNCESLLEKIGVTGERIYHVGDDNTIKSLFNKMETEFVLKKPFYEHRCLGLIYELFSFVGRRLYKGESVEVDADKRIIDICNQMVAYYNEWRDIRYYADLCHLSVSRFSHLFKSQVGKSPLEYVMSIRINHAENMLVETDLSVTEISRLLGFNDHNYFIRTFKQYKGITPFKFKKSLEK